MWVFCEYNVSKMSEKAIAKLIFGILNYSFSGHSEQKFTHSNPIPRNLRTAQSSTAWHGKHAPRYDPSSFMTILAQREENIS